VRWPIAVLSRIEDPFVGVLPVTAGQLCAFVYDGLCESEPPAIGGVRPTITVDEIVAEWAGG